ncbi:MAG TPA: hypothetical protein VN699_20715 [Pirellulales bacterium]|nr:hypothetical protein [Pirellulales bacterium]
MGFVARLKIVGLSAIYQLKELPKRCLDRLSVLASPEFSRNWDSVFAKKAGTKTAAKTATASKAKKSAPKKKKKGGK